MGRLRFLLVAVLAIALWPCTAYGNGCLCTVEYVNPPDMVAPWGQVNIDDLFEVLACWGEDVPPEKQHANVVDFVECNEEACESINDVNIDDLFAVLWFWGEYPN